RRILNDSRNDAGAPEDVRLARRGLAAALVMGGDATRFSEALKGIDQNLKGGATEADKRIKAAGLAPRPKDHPDAHPLLEESFTHPPPPTPDHEFLLARLYELNGDWTRAHERMAALLTTHGDNPLYLAHYIRGLLRDEKYPEAQTWLDKLRAMQPHTF